MPSPSVAVAEIATAFEYTDIRGAGTLTALPREGRRIQGGHVSAYAEEEAGRWPVVDSPSCSARRVRAASTSQQPRAIAANVADSQCRSIVDAAVAQMNAIMLATTS